MNRHTIWLLNIFILVICSFSRSSLSFEIEEVTPRSYSYVDRDDFTIEITFDEEVDEESALSNIFIRSAQTGFMNFQVDMAGATIRLILDSLARYGEIITVTVTNQVQSVEDTTLTRPYHWTYYINTPNGLVDFYSVPDPPFINQTPIDLTVGDFNNDGWIDLCGVFDKRIGIWQNFYPTHFENDHTEQPFDINPDWSIPLSAQDLPYSVSSMDYDHDGDLDIVYVTHSSNQLGLLINNSQDSLVFEPLLIEPNPHRPTKVITADMNSDGWTDIVVSASPQDSIWIYSNAEDGVNFIRYQVPTGRLPIDMTISDFDSSGFLDIAFVERGSDDVVIAWNNGNFQFDNQVIIANDRIDNPTRITSGDLNGDAFPDIIAFSEQSRSYQVYTNQQRFNHRSFGDQREDVSKGPFFYPSEIILADLDGTDFHDEGDLDRIFIGTAQIPGNVRRDIRIRSNQDSIKIFSYDHDVQFPVKVTYADLDNDGDNDLLYMNSHRQNIIPFLNKNGNDRLDIEIESDSIDFGECSVLDSTYRRIRIRTSEDGVTLYRAFVLKGHWDILLSDIFFINDTNAYIRPNRYLDINVGFNPNYRDILYQDTLRLVFSGGAEHDIPLSGTGLQATMVPLMREMEFDTVKIGQEDYLDFEIANPGNTNLEVGFENTDTINFPLRIDNLSVPPGRTSEIRLFFEPQIPGNLSDTVYFHSNDRYNRLDTLFLFGHALPNEPPRFIAPMIPDSIEITTNSPNDPIDPITHSFRIVDDNNNLESVTFETDVSPFPVWIEAEITEFGTALTRGNITLTPPYEAFSTVLSIIAKDDAGLEARDSITIIIGHPPLILGLPENDTFIVYYDTVRTDTFSLQDLDGNLEFIDAAPSEDWELATLDTLEGMGNEITKYYTVTFRANSSMESQYLLFTAQDFSRNVDRHNTWVTIHQAPRLDSTLTDKVRVPRNRTHSIPFTSSDLNGDADPPYLAIGPDWVEISGGSGHWSLDIDTRNQINLEDTFVQIRIEDGVGYFDKKDIWLIINNLPKIEFPETLHLIAGSDTLVPLSVSDPDTSDILNIRLFTAPNWIGLETDLCHIWMRPEDFDRSETFEIIVDDRLLDGRRLDRVSKSVRVNVYHPPEITFEDPRPNTRPDTLFIRDDVQSTYSYEINDPDNDLTGDSFQVLGSGSWWIQCDTLNRQVTFTPTINSKNDSLLITAWDAFNLWDSLQVYVSVLFIDDPPIITCFPLEPLMVQEMDSLSFIVTAESDSIESEPLMFNLPYQVDEYSWLTLDSLWLNTDSTAWGARIWARPFFHHAGSYDLEFEAIEMRTILPRDTSNLITTEIINLIVEKHPIGPRLVTKPNPFTPNNDSYNDRAGFRIEFLFLANPSIKIFSMGGRLIKELTKVENGYIYWDGTDKTGDLELPGVFLYVLLDGNRKVESGVVGLAL